MLVTIDTLRADRLGAYGNTTVATPNLDRLAREGAMALHASAQVPLTRPSHVSLLTGLYPAEHGIRDNVSPPLRPGVPLLAEILQQRGFRTGAFVSSIVLSKQSGLGRGFDTYADRFEIGDDDARFLNTIQKRGDTTVAEAAAWLRQPGPERRFAWVHLYDPHDPYEPPEPYATRYAGRLYDGEVAWSDDLVGRLDAVLAETGRRDDTLLVVTADHGEGLDEHGEAVHGFFVYETTLHVPLIVRGPRVTPGTKVKGVTRSIDVMPTVLDLLGLADATPAVSGRSLAPALTGKALTDEPTFAESLTPLIHYGWSDLRALRDGRWKYILAPRPELYDLDQDPGELKNLVDEEPKRARAYRSGIEQQLRQEQAARRGAESATATVPPDMLEKLGALGYVSGGVSAGRALRRRSQGQDRGIQDAQHADARGPRWSARRAIRRQPGALPVAVRPRRRQFRVPLLRGPRAERAERWREAAVHYEGGDRKSFPATRPRTSGSPTPTSPMDGSIRRSTRCGEGRRPLPMIRRLIEREGDIERRRGGRDVAARAYERVAQMAPRDALVRIKLGEVYRDLGRPADAARRDARGHPAGSGDGVVLEFPRDGARRGWRLAGRRTGVSRGRDPRRAQRAVRLQPRAGPGAAAETRGGRRAVSARARARPAVRSGAATAHGVAIGDRPALRADRDGRRGGVDLLSRRWLCVPQLGRSVGHSSKPVARIPRRCRGGR